MTSTQGDEQVGIINAPEPAQRPSSGMATRKSSSSTNVRNAPSLPQQRSFEVFPSKSFFGGATVKTKNSTNSKELYPSDLSKVPSGMFRADQASQYEDDMMQRILHMVQELTEQLTHNQKKVAELQSQAGVIKNHAVNNMSGVVLRRKAVNLADESFESVLERSSAQLIIENQTLLQENKQLNMLLKEYEQTLETVMIKFKGHSVAAQQHEQNLKEHYSALLQASQAALENEPTSNEFASRALQSLYHDLQVLIREMHADGNENHDINEETPLEDLLDQLEVDDWEDIREQEIARLEEENRALRKLLEIDDERAKEVGISEEDVQIFKPTRRTRQPFVHGDIHAPDMWGIQSPPTQHQPLPEVPSINGPLIDTPNAPAPLSTAGRNFEIQSGMRTGGSTLRRSALFGQRGRGNGAPPWAGLAVERQLLLRGHGDATGLDLDG